MGSIFRGDGNTGPPRFVGVVRRDPMGVLRPEDPLLTSASAGGGNPMSLETVYGSSYPALTAWSMYLANSRCSVG